MAPQRVSDSFDFCNGPDVFEREQKSNQLEAVNSGEYRLFEIRSMDRTCPYEVMPTLRGMPGCSAGRGVTDQRHYNNLAGRSA